MSSEVERLTGFSGPHRLAYRPAEFAQVVGVSLTKIYAEIGAGRLIARKFGSSTLIDTQEGLRWLRSLPIYTEDSMRPTPRARRNSSEKA